MFAAHLRRGLRFLRMLPKILHLGYDFGRILHLGSFCKMRTDQYQIYDATYGLHSLYSSYSCIRILHPSSRTAVARSTVPQYSRVA